MAGHTPWREVRARKGPDTPEGAAMRAAFRQAMSDALHVGEAREARGAIPPEHAEASDGSQARVSDLEWRADLYLSALQDYVALLGGELVLTAVFPDQRIDLALPAPAPSERPAQPVSAAQR